MHSGSPDRRFFFRQALEFINEYNETLPEHTPTPEEVDSGLTGLSEDFGFSATLFDTSEAMSISPETFCHQWNVKEFYHLIRYRAWKAHAQNEYRKQVAAQIEANSKHK